MNKGNMYDWVDKTWNPLAGECPHNCSYCFVETLRKRLPNLKKKYSGKPRLIEHEMRKNLGKGKTWFVCDCTDLFAENVPEKLIHRVLEHCWKFGDNTYLFQTKNPQRFSEKFVYRFPPKTILGTTIESNRDYKLSSAPSVEERIIQKVFLKNKIETRIETMISIEPMLDFDLEALVLALKLIKPDFVSIGADSKGHNLPEPSPEKVKALIKELRGFTKVYVKSNLKRLGVEK